MYLPVINLEFKKIMQLDDNVHPFKDISTNVIFLHCNVHFWWVLGTVPYVSSKAQKVVVCVVKNL